MFNKKTPYISISSSQIILNLKNFCEKLNLIANNIYYPIKVNNDPKIIKLLQNHLCNFEAASLNEINILKNCKINPDSIIYGNPVKSTQDIFIAYNIGIRKFVADSLQEIEKLSYLAKFSKVIIRLTVSNEGATWKLTDKFGCSFNDLLLLTNILKDKNLEFHGISFHVGWNNKSIENWKKVFYQIDSYLTQILQSNNSISIVDIGGGFPAHDLDSEKYFNEISLKILPYIKKWQKFGLTVLAEPGSYLLANAGTMYAKVIERINRNNKIWLYLDSGIFQGFYWILAGIDYRLKNETRSLSKLNAEFIVCGPTCDSYDIFSRNAILPEETNIGDIISISPAGAYITSSQNYNGFEYPPQIIENHHKNTKRK